MTCSYARKPSTIVLQVFQESVVIVQDHDALAVREGLPVGLQAAMEGIERRVAAVGIGIDARRLGIACTTQAGRVALRLGQDRGRLAVGLVAELLRGVLALGPP